jgi:hypothetical protein
MSNDLIEALEASNRWLKDLQKRPGLRAALQPDIDANEAILKRHRSQQEAAQEPVGRFCMACAVRDAAIGQKPSLEVTPAYLEWLATKSRSAGVGGNEAWNAGVEWQKSQVHAPSESAAKDAARYRWLRDVGYDDPNDGTLAVFHLHAGKGDYAARITCEVADLDKTIDAAMAASGGESDAGREGK